MRLLFESQSSTDLSLAKELLEENGIPVFISSEKTFQLKPSLVLHKKGLWICLDEQFSDATKLLKNPSHAVSKPVDVVAFHSSLEESQKESLNSLWINKDKIFNFVLSVVLIGFIGAVVIAVLVT